VHLIRNTLHGAITYANLAGDLDDAHTGPQTILDALFDGCADPRPSERLARLDSPLEAGLDTLTDHATLELRERAGDLKHELAHWRRGVD
jgi:hypothetical protein